jgi:hypothetical protein
MKIVLYCAKFKLNGAIDDTQMKVDTKLMELVLKCANGKLNHSVIKVATKTGNIELKVDT